MIQTSNPSFVGYNGLGGIKLEGNITKYEVNKGKKKNPPTISIDFTNSVVGHGRLFITMSSQNRATARLSDNWGNRNTWEGRLFHPDETINFEGQSLR